MALFPHSRIIFSSMLLGLSGCTQGVPIALAPHSDSDGLEQHDDDEMPSVDSDADDPNDSQDDSGTETDPPVPDTLPDVPADLRSEAWPGAALFDLGQVQAFALTLSSESWNALSRDPREYTGASLDADGQVLEVGVRLKGSSTYESISAKPSFKVDVNWVDSEQKLHGKKKFNLHNQTLDPSFVSEALTFALFREADLPAPRVGWVWLQVNDEDYGFYTIVEEPDDEFIDLWFEEDDGNLYENLDAYCDVTDPLGCFDAEEFDEKNHDAFLALGSAATTRGEEWDTHMQALMDWERFTRFFAMEAAIGHWDSYSYDISNYRLYHQPVADNWTFIPWSADLGFSYRPWSYPDCGQYATNPDGYDMGILAGRCAESTICRGDVKTAILAIADQLDAFDISGRIDTFNAVIREHVQADPNRSYGMDDFVDHQACIIDFVNNRSAYLRGWAETAP